MSARINTEEEEFEEEEVVYEEEEVPEKENVEKEKEQPKKKEEIEVTLPISNTKKRVFRILLSLGMLGIVIYFASLIYGNLNQKKYNSITDSIGELTLGKSKLVNTTREIQSWGWNLYLGYQYAFITFSFMYSGKLAGFGNIMFLFSLAFDRVGYSATPYSRMLKPHTPESMLVILSSILTALFMVISLIMMINGFKEHSYHIGIANLIKKYMVFIIIFLIAHIVVLLTSTKLFGLTQRLYTYTEMFLVFHLSLYMTFKVKYVETTKKVKTD